MSLRLLSREELTLALPLSELIPAMAEAFKALAQGRALAPPRQAISQGPGSTTLLMAAAIPGIGLASKTVSVFDGNARLGRPVVNGLVMAMDPETGEPRGLCDGGVLTALRTGAVTGAVMDLLAPAQATRGALIGCGGQARTQLLAMDVVRPFEEIRICGRERLHVESFVSEMNDQVSCRLIATGSAAEAINGVQVVTTATNARDPVLKGSDLAPGCHVNAVGSYTLAMRELDRDTLDGARIFVDEIHGALSEAGELVDAEQAGLTRRQDWTEIGRLFLDPETHRPPPGARTVFKSVGHAVQDVAAAALALANAERLQLGTLIDL